MSLPESNFLEDFLKLQEKYPSASLKGDLVLGEKIDDSDFQDTKTGLVLPESQDQKFGGIHSDKPVFMRVLAVGPGFEGEPDPECKPGQVVLIGKHSYQQFSKFGSYSKAAKASTKTPVIMTRDHEVQMRWENKEDFENYFKILNGDT